ncbi:MAG: hypothetical protein MJE77_33040 [Proteobacteria bacterium]|nr:hypothetical protein [Pseudomonadota bacterium]
MAQKIGYHATIGSQIASSRPNQGERQLLALFSELSMDSIGGRCRLELGGNRVEAPAPGDAISVELSAGESSAAVFTGEVEAVEVTATSQRIVASDGLVKLGRLDIEVTYEDVSVDFIVKDLLDQAGISIGTIDTGPDLAVYVIHRGPRALHYAQELAALCGADLYTDGRGAAHFASPRQGAADHRFSYGESVISLDLYRPPLVVDSIAVWGEGAAGSKGADKTHWLASDLAGVSGKAAIDASGATTSGSLGQSPRQLKSGAVRTGEAAQACADGHMAALASRRVRGRVDIFGTPGIEPGDLIDIADLPDQHAATSALLKNHTLRVRQVRHLMSRRRGYITRLEF